LIENNIEFYNGELARIYRNYWP